MTKKKPKLPTGIIYAIKKSKRAASFMPDEVVVLLDGEAKGQLLITCGWTMTVVKGDKACKLWPIGRLQKNLGRIEEDWADDVGKGWRLEIRSMLGA